MDQTKAALSDMASQSIMAQPLKSTSAARNTKLLPPIELSSAPRGSTNQLTPPTTPNQSIHDQTLDRKRDWSTMNPNSVLAWTGSYKPEKLLGEGSWSEVYAAVNCNHEHATNSKTTPPVTPIGSPKKQGKQPDVSRSNTIKPATLLAVKVPAHKMAYPIVKNEAMILTYLTSHPAASENIIEFYGEDESNSALVFARAERSLMDIACIARKSPAESISKTDPIITTSFWLLSANRLISALSWIHENNIVHGDVKPENILEVVDSAGNRKLVFADFSSSFYLSPSGTYESKKTDAITTSYASPELLKSYSLSRPIEDTSPRHPTCASDIWALACTLLTAATGYEPYHFAGNNMRKISMAKEGSVMASYLNADDWQIGMRVRAGGIVERVVKPGLIKLVEKRTNTADWHQLVQEVAAEAKVEL